MSYLRVTPKQAYKWIEHCAQRGLVPYLKGSPGTAKSSIVHQLAEDFNLKLIDFRLSQAMPEDLNGVPMRSGDKAQFVPFDTFPIEGDTLPKGKDGWVLFLDELSSANKQVQAAAYKLILDRMTGSHKLHPNVVIVAAGNLMSDKAVVVQMSTALQSRVIHFELEVSSKESIDYAIQNNWDPRVIAFMAYKPSAINNFKPDHAENTFACPRTWEFVSRLIKDCDIDDSWLPLIAGAIGEGMAVEFLGFAKEYDRLPKLEEILKNPMYLPLPSELATRYATATMLAEHIKADNAKDLLVYIGRLDIEMQIIFHRMALTRDFKLPEKSKEFALSMRNLAKYLQ